MVDKDIVQAACEAYSKAAGYSMACDATMRMRMTAALEAVIATLKQGKES